MARTFDGSSTSLTTSDPPITGVPCTLTAWIRPASVTINHVPVFFGDFDFGSNANLIEILGRTDGDVNASIRGPNNVLNSSALGASSLVLNQWQHLAGVFASLSSCTVYLDGVAGTEGTTTVEAPSIDGARIGDAYDPFGQHWDGDIAEVGIFNVALTADEIAMLYAGYPPWMVRGNVEYLPIVGGSPEPSMTSDRDYTVNGTAPVADHPPQVGRWVRRRSRIFVAAGGATFPVGLALETNTALGVSSAKSQTVGLGTETDTGLSVGAAKSRTVGLASETDAAFGLTVAKALAVALTVETDSALPVTASGAVDVGLAIEADSALGVGALKTVAVGLSTETDSALTVTPLTGTSVGLATEADAALAVSIAKALSVGLSTEADAALEATPVRTIVLGQASEADTAFALAALKSVTTGLAIETDAGLVVVASKAQSVGLALETDTSFAVVVEGVVVLFPITSKTGPALGGSMFGKATGGSMFGKALQE